MAASTTTYLPRFLLPQTSRLWARLRVPNVGSTGFIAIRYASSTTTKKEGRPLVLEKPARFNPPSHGSRLPTGKKAAVPKHYGGDLSAQEVQAQKRKDYPGMMAPEGTWAHWFWNSRAFHLFITLSTLTGLAVFTFVQNFKHNNAFAEMIPPLPDFLYHPVSSMRTMMEVIRLSEAHNSAIVAEKRKRRVDDVVKRSEYRKAHGLEEEGRFGSWTAKTDAEALGPALPSAAGGDGSASSLDGPRKKWLGIF